MSSKLLVIACWVLRFAPPSRSPWHWLERWLKKIQKILQGRMLHVGTQKVLYTSLWQPLTWEQESGKSRGFQDLPPKDTQLTSGVIKRGWLENPHLYRWCSHDGLQNNSKISMDFPATHYPHVGALGLWMVTRVPTGWSVTRAPALWMLWAFDLFWPEKMGGCSNLVSYFEVFQLAVIEPWFWGYIPTYGSSPWAPQHPARTAWRPENRWNRWTQHAPVIQPAHIPGCTCHHNLPSWAVVYTPLNEVYWVYRVAIFALRCFKVCGSTALLNSLVWLEDNSAWLAFDDPNIVVHWHEILEKKTVVQDCRHANQTCAREPDSGPWSWITFGYRPECL